MKKYDENDLALVKEALYLLRQDVVPTLADLRESDEPLCAKVRSTFEASRLEVLLARDWSFCRTRRSVAAEAEERRGGAFTFRRPADAARIVAVGAEGGEVAWRVYGDEVRCDAPPEIVTYVRDEPDLDAWPPLVRRAFAYRLAADLALSVTGRNADFEQLSAAYESRLSASALANAKEDNPAPRAWGRGRYGAERPRRGVPPRGFGGS